MIEGTSIWIIFFSGSGSGSGCTAVIHVSSYPGIVIAISRVDSI